MNNINNNDYNLEVGTRIRNIRESLNMTLKKICQAANYSADYVVFGDNDNIATRNILHIIDSIPTNKRDSALIILREYAKTVK